MAEIRFHDEDWERIEKVNHAWWEGELERPLVYLTLTDPGIPRPKSYMSNYPLNMPADQVVDYYEPVLSHTTFYGDAFPWLWVNFGPGIAAGFLGSQVNSVESPSETVWFSPKTNVALGELDFAYDPNNVWWLRVKAITQALVNRFGARLAVSHTDLGGNLDILASFRETQTLLVDLMDNPELVQDQRRKLTELWIRYYDELDQIIRPACRGTSCWTPIWSTQKTYMLQSDFCYMISPKMFERFVLPDITACCDYLDDGFYHLDGKGQIPHLNYLLSIARLRGIQWIPGDGQPGPEEWLPLLKRIRDGGKLCQVFVRPEGALKIVRNLGGKGFMFVISTGVGSIETSDQVEAFLNTLFQESKS